MSEVYGESYDKIILYPDGDWFYKSEYDEGERTYRSDDYEIVDVPYFIQWENVDRFLAERKKIKAENITVNVLDAYIDSAKRTDLTEEQYAVSAPILASKTRLMHALIGMQTEIGELLDDVKREVFYGKSSDQVNIAEETGDIAWYFAILIDEVGKMTGLKPVEILGKNIEKLKARYPDKFSGEAALNRDVQKEREILENP